MTAFAWSRAGTVDLATRASAASVCLRRGGVLSAAVFDEQQGDVVEELPSDVA